MPAEATRFPVARTAIGEVSFVFDRKLSLNGECRFAWRDDVEILAARYRFADGRSGSVKSNDSAAQLDAPSDAN